VKHECNKKNTGAIFRSEYRYSIVLAVGFHIIMVALETKIQVTKGPPFCLKRLHKRPVTATKFGGWFVLTVPTLAPWKAGGD
jgi:hypothetical protein